MGKKRERRRGKGKKSRYQEVLFVVIVGAMDQTLEEDEISLVHFFHFLVSLHFLQLLILIFFLVFEPKKRLVTLRQNVNLRISVKNPLSDDEIRENVIMNPTETIDQDESAREPPHHLALKWEGSKKVSILQILNDTETTSALKKKKYKGPKIQQNSYSGDDSGQWVPLLCMECRGLEPYAFKPMKDEFIVESVGGTQFTEDIEFDNDGEWADYDADHDVSVSLSQVEFKFQSV